MSTELQNRSTIRDWLREILADGPVSVAKIKTAVEEHGYSWCSVRFVKGTMPIKSQYHHGDKCQWWEWELEKDVNNPVIAKDRVETIFKKTKEIARDIEIEKKFVHHCLMELADSDLFFEESELLNFLGGFCGLDWSQGRRLLRERLVEICVKMRISDDGDIPDIPKPNHFYGLSNDNKELIRKQTREKD